jgi:hypothetical protein
MFIYCSVANVFAAACEYLIIKRTNQRCPLSRLFINYNGRAMDARRIIGRDAGSTLSHTARGLRRYGICEEAFWRYSRRNVTVRPPNEAYRRASKFHVELQQIPHNLDAMRMCLASGVPFAMSIVFTKKQAEETHTNGGFLPFPDTSSSTPSHQLALHAMLVVGYDDHRQHFLVRNSFGRHWVRFTTRSSFRALFSLIY